MTHLTPFILFYSLFISCQGICTGSQMQPEQVSECSSNIIIIIIIIQYNHQQGRSHSWICFRGLCSEGSGVVLSCTLLLSVRPLCYSPMGMIFRVKAPEPRNFSEAPMVYFCNPLWCVSAQPNQLGPAWLCAAHGAVQEGPVTPDGSSVPASERV